jgi:protein-S-isoprenylcysteine O-methyltransferase Ste14
MIGENLILAGLLVAWCTVHSATISGPIASRVQARLGSAARIYRLLYNAVAGATFIPVVAYAWAVRTEPFFAWEGGLRVIQFAFLATALPFFVLGFRRYHLGQMVGLSQLRGDALGKGIAAGGRLDTGGILGVVRHPMYFATALLLWARPLDVSAIIVNTILTLYLVVGTLLEERRLVGEFGDAYRAYQKDVPMLVPYKWAGQLLRARRGAR